MNEQTKLFIDLSLMHYEHGKNAFLLRVSQVDTWQRRCGRAERALLLGSRSFPQQQLRAGTSTEQALYGKRGNYYLHCQIPAPFTVLLVIISSTVKASVIADDAC